MTRLILSLAAAAAVLAILWLPSFADAQPSTAAPTANVEAPAPTTADTSTVPDPTTDLGGYTAAVLDAIRGGRWLVTFGLFLVGAWWRWRGGAWPGSSRGSGPTAVGPYSPR